MVDLEAQKQGFWKPLMTKKNKKKIESDREEVFSGVEISEPLSLRASEQNSWSSPSVWASGIF